MASLINLTRYPHRIPVGDDVIELPASGRDRGTEQSVELSREQAAGFKASKLGQGLMTAAPPRVELRG